MLVAAIFIDEISEEGGGCQVVEGITKLPMRLSLILQWPDSMSAPHMTKIGPGLAWLGKWSFVVSRDGRVMFSYLRFDRK